MSAGGAMPCGSSRLLRLDPSALPVQFFASDALADGRVRCVELHRERVVIRRSLAGMRMALSLPLRSFLGIVLRIVPPDQASEGAVVIALEHRDAALAVSLFAAPDGVEALAEWRAWGCALGLPLLVAGEGGALREAFRPAAGAARLHIPRRCGCPLKRRRPRLSARRRTGRPPRAPASIETSGKSSPAVRACFR
jgi:hypothetical protein